MKKVICVIVFLAVCFGSRQAFDHSLWFMSDREAEGYLPISKMNVYDAEGRAQAKLGSPLFSYEYYDIEEDDLYIDGMLDGGSSWEEFVSVYGEYFFSGIQVTSYDMEDGYAEYAGYDYFTDDISIAEFHKMYVETGIVDPSVQEIDVTFSADYFGNTIYYDEDAYYEAMWQYEDSLLSMIIREPRQGWIYCSFHFSIESAGNQEGLNGVSISRYAY